MGCQVGDFMFAGVGGSSRGQPLGGSFEKDFADAFTLCQIDQRFVARRMSDVGLLTKERILEQILTYRNSPSIILFSNDLL